MRSHTAAEEEEEKVSLVIQTGWINVFYIHDKSNLAFDEELSKDDRGWS